MRLITPDNDITPYTDGVNVFLAGTIDLGNSVDWQTLLAQELEQRFADTALNVYSPRRAEWFGTPTTDNPEFIRQVVWEMDNLEAADIIVMRMLADSKSPVSLLELGLHAHSGKLIVFCEDGFWRKGNVDLTCWRHAIAQVDSTAALLDELRSRIENLADRFWAEFSEEDGEWAGHMNGQPYLSWMAPTKDAALDGIRKLAESEGLV